MNRVAIRKFFYGFIGTSIIVWAAFGIWYSGFHNIGTFFSQSALISGLPSEETAVGVVSEKVLLPGGQSVGVKMDVKGVLVVGLEEIDTLHGKSINPGLKAGLEIGDSILTINGETVNNAREVQKKINKVKEKVRLKVMRKGEAKIIYLSPVLSADDNTYKMGVWVRDKTAGLGTMTFYDPEKNIFGALGHAITDPDTGDVLSVAKGELIDSKVESVKQGKAGEPGEIRGIFYEADEPLGALKNNSDFGIFGYLYHPIENPLFLKPIAVGYQDQVHKGDAYILSTLDGNKVEKYSVMIEKINHQSKPDTKSMIIKVTDKRLLEKSGGIVQGMSGSPIIQDNKIIGAVTHVFVNDPEKGYGIFIEWMLKESEKIEQDETSSN
ncbi:SpoIVB peptidase [Sinanaerobacter sp. ZZT-01]|uniref:SpoIVB peptidase n=1 Tax=Sinanaerobacter sp. ZZT-01 TaxID=3111540 RepID=UPI002D7677A5|nr:SpoIVB peptidase [Sinanaerobacter sp. ZZT-01]WRR93088.1 SpoIVB peptidase [Sinanaerobacter sp. ZZT-01]